MMKKALFSVIPIVLSILVIVGLIATKPETRAELQEETLTRVFTTEVRQMDIRPMRQLTGKLQPARQSELRFEISGNIISREIEPGYKVQSGDTLLSLDPGDYQDRVSEAEALVAQELNAIARDRKLLQLLQAQRDVQEREVKRLERLGKDSLATKSSYDNALKTLIQIQSDEASLRHNVNNADSRKKVLQASLKQAQRNLARTSLLAPYDGTINQVMYELGDYARAGEVAVQIVQLLPLDIYLEVSGDLIAVLSIGQRVTVSTQQQSLEGEVIAIQSDPEQDTLTHGIRIRIEEEGLFPGQLVDVELPGQAVDGVAAVPLTSLMYQEGQAYVFQVENEVLQRVPVELIARQGEWQGVTGLPPGVFVVSQDVAVLSDAQKVSVHQ